MTAEIKMIQLDIIDAGATHIKCILNDYHDSSAKKLKL